MALSSYLEAIFAHDETFFIENDLELLFRMSGILFYLIVTFFHFSICLGSFAIAGREYEKSNISPSGIATVRDIPEEDETIWRRVIYE